MMLKCGWLAVFFFGIFHSFFAPKNIVTFQIAVDKGDEFKHMLPVREMEMYLKRQFPSLLMAIVVEGSCSYRMVVCGSGFIFSRT